MADVPSSSPLKLKKNRVSKFPPVLIMYHPSMQGLAERLVRRVQERELKEEDELVADRYRTVELWEGITWGRFKDSWPNIFIENVDTIAGRDVIFLASFHEPHVIFEQLSLIYSLPRYVVRSFRLILPFFPTGTMERVDTEGQVITAKTLATMLSQIPLATRGPAQITIFDIHALQERFYFTDQVIPRLLTAMPLLVRELEQLEKNEDNEIVIVFPDEGAYKRFHTDLERWPAITCVKIREGEERVVHIKDGDPKGCHAVIVDDLVQTGGTIIQCAKVVHAANAKAVSVFVTHPVFPQQSWQKFKPEKCSVKFANVWVTDSLPQAKDLEGHSPFHVLSLCDVIADSLLGYDLLSTNL